MSSGSVLHLFTRRWIPLEVAVAPARSTNIAGTLGVDPGQAPSSTQAWRVKGLTDVLTSPSATGTPTPQPATAKSHRQLLRLREALVFPAACDALVVTLDLIGDLTLGLDSVQACVYVQPPRSEQPLEDSH